MFLKFSVNSSSCNLFLDLRSLSVVCNVSVCACKVFNVYLRYLVSFVYWREEFTFVAKHSDLDRCNR